MKISFSTIYVNDLEESLRFYRDIMGLDVLYKQSFRDLEFIFLGNDEFQIEILKDHNLDKVDLGRDVSLAFRVDSLEDASRHFTENGIEVSDVLQISPAMKFFFIKDPNGFKLQIFQRDE